MLLAVDQSYCFRVRIELAEDGNICNFNGQATWPFSDDMLDKAIHVVDNRGEDMFRVLLTAKRTVDICTLTRLRREDCSNVSSIPILNRVIKLGPRVSIVKDRP